MTRAQGNRGLSPITLSGLSPITLTGFQGFRKMNLSRVSWVGHESSNQFAVPGLSLGKRFLGTALAAALALATVGPLFLPGTASAASFDCRRAETPIEHAICDDKELSDLDEQLAAAYRSALAKAKDSDALRRSQREWIAEREKAAAAVANGGQVNVYGLKHLYRMRIIEVGAFTTPLSRVLGSYTKSAALESVDPEKPGGFVQYGVHEDYVNLEQNTDGKIRVALWLTYANSHLCQMEGAGTWKESYVLVEQKSELSGAVCRLRIVSDGNSVLLKDQDFNCTRMSCGARGSLDGTIVSRKKP